MKLIVAIVRPERFSLVLEALFKAHLPHPQRRAGSGGGHPRMLASCICALY